MRRRRRRNTGGRCRPSRSTPRTPDPKESPTPLVEATGKLSEALERVERARGALYEFHQLIGGADALLDEVVAGLAEAGHPELADRVRDELIGLNVLAGRWTFQVVEEFDDGYYATFRELERLVRDETMAGRRHVFEAELKQRRRTRGRPAGHPGPTPNRELISGSGRPAGRRPARPGRRRSARGRRRGRREVGVEVLVEVGDALPAVAVVGPVPPQHVVDAQLLAVGQRAGGDPIPAAPCGRRRREFDRLPARPAQLGLVVQTRQEPGRRPGPRRGAAEVSRSAIAARGRLRRDPPLGPLRGLGQPGRLDQHGHVQRGRQATVAAGIGWGGEAPGHRRRRVAGDQAQHRGRRGARGCRLLGRHRDGRDGHGQDQRTAGDRRGGQPVARRRGDGCAVAGRRVGGDRRRRPGGCGAGAGRRRTGVNDRGLAGSPVHVPAAENAEPSHVPACSDRTALDGRRLGIRRGSVRSGGAAVADLVVTIVGRHRLAMKSSPERELGPACRTDDAQQPFGRPPAPDSNETCTWSMWLAVGLPRSSMGCQPSPKLIRCRQIR